MNAGATLDEILHSVSVPEATLGIPYLRPMYDEPEFVIRNIWRLYGGWWDGNPARLKPASDGAVGAEIVALAGSMERLLSRAARAVRGRRPSTRLPARRVRGCRRTRSRTRCTTPAPRSTRPGDPRETSLMAKGIYQSAVADSQTVLTGSPPPFNLVLTIGES